MDPHSAASRRRIIATWLLPTIAATSLAAAATLGLLTRPATDAGPSSSPPASVDVSYLDAPYPIPPNVPTGTDQTPIVYEIGQLGSVWIGIQTGGIRLLTVLHPTQSQASVLTDGPSEIKVRFASRTETVDFDLSVAHGKLVPQVTGVGQTDATAAAGQI